MAPVISRSDLYQLHALGDIDLASFFLEMKNKAGIQLVDQITSATISRTTEGASTLIVNVEDDDVRTIQTSGKLGRKVDVQVDGLYFTLVAVSKTGRNLQLTFEDRSVNLLRYYQKFIFSDRTKSTRAQFVLRMIKEVKEIAIKWYIPELSIKQPISDVQPGEILISSTTGAPISTKTTDGATQFSRQPGLSLASGFTVRGAPASAEQIGNAETILQVGEQKGARRKVLVCSIMTAIDESNIIDELGGDLDSVGVFQQRASQGWPATRDVAVDAGAFFDAAIALDREYPNLSYNDLCQGVQHSGTPTAYGQFQAEAEKFVTAFGVPGGDYAVGAAGAANNSRPTPPTNSIGTTPTGQYMRGRITTNSQGQSLLTPENSWQAMQRLASEVNWRCFCVSGTIYFIDDDTLFKAKPFMVIDEDTDGIDWIDYDYDEGKRVATVTVTAHLGRWSAPPGSTVEIKNMGIPNGKHLVTQIDRSLYDTIGTITLKKPQPVLPEPTSLDSTNISQQTPPSPGGPSLLPPGQGDPLIGATGSVQQKIVDYALQQIGVPYVWGAESTGVAFDCSGLAQAAYEAAGISIPRTSQQQFAAGPRVYAPSVLLPGDLVFFQGAPEPTPPPGHVGIYIGDGKWVEAPYTGAVVRVETLDTGGTGENT
jgi:cell wall-associated NlpC family hydrolase